MCLGFHIENFLQYICELIFKVLGYVVLLNDNSVITTKDEVNLSVMVMSKYIVNTYKKMWM